MDRVGFLKPTCLRKIPRQATGDVTENPVEDAVANQGVFCLCRLQFGPPKNAGGGGMKMIENVADVFDRRGWGNL